MHYSQKLSLVKTREKKQKIEENKIKKRKL